jgi:DNA-binding NarL/FixJ family response regulator
MRAVAAVQDALYDVVLMDIQMAEMDGLEATSRIRALPPPASAVPIVAMTANAMRGAREQYLAAGMDDYIAKPIDSAALIAMLDRIADAGLSGLEARPDPPDAPEPAPRPAFDRVRLDDLRAAMAPAAFGALVASFASGLDERVRRALALVAEGKFAEAAREAHDIVGMAGNMGAMRLSALARDLEIAGKAGDAARCGDAARTIAEVSGAALAALASYRAEAA